MLGWLGDYAIDYGLAIVIFMVILVAARGRWRGWRPPDLLAR